MGLHVEKIERWMVTSRQGTKSDMRYRRWLKKMRNRIIRRSADTKECKRYKGWEF